MCMVLATCKKINPWKVQVYIEALSLDSTKDGLHVETRSQEFYNHPPGKGGISFTLSGFG